MATCSVSLSSPEGLLVHSFGLGATVAKSPLHSWSGVVSANVLTTVNLVPLRRRPTSPNTFFIPQPGIGGVIPWRFSLR